MDLDQTLGVAGVVLSLAGFLFTWLRTRMSDVKEYENRLTFLEQNIFSKDDRVCLHELEVKVELFWRIIETEAPKLLKRTITPHLDTLLSKAEPGLLNLSVEERSELVTLLVEQYRAETKGDVEDSGRALVNALYRARIGMSLSLPRSCLVE